LNKSAEILLNSSSSFAVGKKITDVFGVKNSHFMTAIAEVVNSKPFATMLKTQISIKVGAASSENSK
jgi:hypothetical protein